MGKLQEAHGGMQTNKPKWFKWDNWVLSSYDNCVSFIQIGVAGGHKSEIAKKINVNPVQTQLCKQTQQTVAHSTTWTIYTSGKLSKILG